MKKVIASGQVKKILKIILSIALFSATFWLIENLPNLLRTLFKQL